jgi:hypothetical protein
MMVMQLANGALHTLPAAEGAMFDFVPDAFDAILRAPPQITSSSPPFSSFPAFLIPRFFLRQVVGSPCETMGVTWGFSPITVSGSSILGGK